MEVDEGYGLVGRDTLIEGFRQEWKNGNKRIVVVHGPKLVGKSTFVKYFFRAYSNESDKLIEFDFKNIYNIDDFEHELFNHELFEVGHTSDCRRDEDKHSRCSKCARILQGKIKKFGEQRVVFVLDNIQNMCDDGKDRGSVDERPYDLIMRLYLLNIVQKIPNVFLVIISTMRHTFASMKVHYIELQELDNESSLTLLRNVAGCNQGCTEKEGIMVKIANLCGGLPLAIINAGLLFYEETLTPEDILAVICALRIQSLSGEMLQTGDKINFNFLEAFRGLSMKNQEHLLKLAAIVGVSETSIQSIAKEFEYRKDLPIFKWQVLCPLRNRNLIKVNRTTGSVVVANDLMETFLKDIHDVIPFLSEHIRKRIVDLVDKLEKKSKNSDGEENEDSEKYHDDKSDNIVNISGYDSVESDTVNLTSIESEIDNRALSKKMTPVRDSCPDLSMDSNVHFPVQPIGTNTGRDNQNCDKADRTGQISDEGKRQRYQSNDEKQLSTDDNTIYVDDNLNTSAAVTVNKERKQREAEEKKFDVVADMVKERHHDTTYEHVGKGTKIQTDVSPVTAADLNKANCMTKGTELLHKRSSQGAGLNGTDEKENSYSSHRNNDNILEYDSEPRRIGNPSWSTNNVRSDASANSSSKISMEPHIVLLGSFSIEGEDTYLGDHMSRQKIGATQRLDTSEFATSCHRHGLERSTIQSRSVDSQISSCAKGDETCQPRHVVDMKNSAVSEASSTNVYGPHGDRMSFSLEGKDTYLGDNLSRMNIGGTEVLGDSRRNCESTFEQAVENYSNADSNTGAHSRPNVPNNVGFSYTTREEHHFQGNNLENIACNVHNVNISDLSTRGEQERSRRSEKTANYLENPCLDQTQQARKQRFENNYRPQNLQDCSSESLQRIQQEGAIGIENNGRRQQNSRETTYSILNLPSAPALDTASLQEHRNSLSREERLSGHKVTEQKRTEITRGRGVPMKSKETQV